MSERDIIDEIKQLLYYSMNEKARPDGSGHALPFLEEAVKLSNKIKNQYGQMCQSTGSLIYYFALHERLVNLMKYQIY